MDLEPALPEQWFCKMNHGDVKYRSCDAEEQEWSDRK
jgi:hypothetical protein